MGKEEEDVRAAGVFLGGGGGILGIFCIFLLLFAECPAKAKL